MQSSNILSHILSYLTYQELLACSCLNKHFQALCNNTFLWRREALRIGIGNLELFGEPLLGIQNSQKSSSSSKWKELLRGLIESKKYWPTDHSVLEPSDTNNLVKEFLSILREPQMPPPTLRRESKCLPTIFQELLTYYLIDESPAALPSFDDFMTEDILAKLFDWSERLENEFKGSVEKNQFTIARWALKDPKFDSWTLSPFRLSIESTTDTYDQEDDLCQLSQKFPLKNSSPFLIKLYYAIKKTSSVHSKLILASILENEDDLSLCNDYITKWNSYCASIKELNQKYQAFCTLFNEIFNKTHEKTPNFPPFSLLRPMVFQWKRKVFETVKDKLINTALDLLNKWRSDQIDEELSYLLIKIVQALIDHSVNELNVRFLDHSQFYTDGIYEILHQKTVVATLEYYKTLKNLPADKLSEALEKDMNIIQRVFLKRTQIEIEKIRNEIEISAWKSCFCESYKEFKAGICCVNSNVTENLLDSEFGRILFNVDFNKNRIRQFIETLQWRNDKMVENIQHFLKLFERKVELQEKLIDDLIIEEENEQCGFMLEQSPEERILFSLTNDISPQQFMGIVINTDLL